MIGADTSRYEKNKFEERRESEKKEEEKAAKAAAEAAPQAITPVMSKKSFGKYGDLGGEEGSVEATDANTEAVDNNGQEKEAKMADDKEAEAPLSVAQVSKKNCLGLAIG